MSKKIIKLENIFKQAEAFIKRVFSSRFRIYKFIASNLKLTVVFVVLGASATVAAGIAINEYTTEYVEMLVHTSDNVPSKQPRSEWSEDLIREERAGSAKQGYIERVEEEGYEWGTLELDPKRYAVVTIKKEDFNEDWLKPTYDTSRPVYVLNEEGNEISEIANYEVDLMRGYRLPLENILDQAELADLKAIPYNDATERPAIRKTIKDGIAELVIANNFYTDNITELRLHGSSGFKTMCPSGCNYTALSTWESTENADLTGTGPAILEISGVWENEDAGPAQFVGWTTTADDYISIYTSGDARHSGVWSNSAYRIVERNATVSSGIIWIQEEFVRIDGLQIQRAGSVTSGNNFNIWLDNSGIGTDVYISNNIMRGSTTGGAAWQLGFTVWTGGSGTVSLWNNVAYDFNNGGGTNYGIICNDADFTCYAYNNTVRNAGTVGIAQLAGTYTINNNLVQDSTDGFIGTFTNSDYNVSDITSDAPGSHSQTGEVTFIDETKGNFQLALTDAFAKDYGTNTSGSAAPLNFTTDIAGNSRTMAWDIGAFEVPDQLTGQWKFDEGYASTTSDSLNFNDGTLQDNTTWVDGRFNKGLSFDGNNNYVSIADNSAVEFATSTGFTVSAWFKTATSTPTNQQMILTKASASQGGYKVYLDSDGSLGFGTDDDAAWTPDDEAATTETGYADNNWHQVVGTRTASSTALIIYVDGVKKATDTSITPVSTQNTGSFTIGIDRDGASFPFEGIIDDVRVYNYSLTDSQINGLFISGSADEPASVSIGANFGNGVNTDISQHLVGYWNFDETATSTAGDISGFNNHGTDFYTTASSTGKYGYARDFNNSNSSISIGNTGQSIKTASFWVWPDSTTEDFIDFDGGTHSIEANGGVITATGFNNALIYVNGERSAALTAEVWQQITVTTDTAFTASNLVLGTETDFLGGALDDIKIFNAALSDEQILQEYLDGPGPVGYWRFEEQTGQTVNDVSGNLANGTLGASASAGSDDPAWKSLGIVGGALSFDGNDDYVNVVSQATLQIPGSFTVSAWVYFNMLPTSLKTYAIINKGLETSEASGNNDNYFIGFDQNLNGAGYNINCGYENSSGTDISAKWLNFGSAIVLKKWYYLTCAHDATADTLTLFVDTTQRAINTSATATPDTGTNSLEFGDDFDNISGVGEFFDGLLDEVKLYNYARTLRDIAFDYSGGAPLGYWKFDEGYASTTADLSGRGKSGTLADNTLWTLNGKFGAALNFDGTNDYVNIGDLNASTSAVSFWVYPDALNKDIIDFDGGTHSIEVSSGGVLSATGFTSPKIYVNGNRSATLTTGAWQNIAVTTDTSFAVSALQIGTETSFFDGRIDDVKIYSYVRTPAEIRQDYTAGGSAGGAGAVASFGAMRDKGSTWDDGGFGGAAPAGWWKFEELTGQNVNDFSGAVVTAGTLGANSSVGTDDPAWSYLGKVGNALDFDGTDDFVNIGSTGQSVQTASFWIKADSATGDIIDFDSGTHSVEISSGTLTATGFTSPTMYINASSTNGNNIIPVGKWKHITVTTGTGFTASNLQVGTETAFFDGLIDEIKIYSYARSLPQIVFDYDGGKPTGHWKFDEGEGGTAYDVSGNNKNGLLYPGSGGGNTATSTMWSNGSSGKINGALDFDGTDDYVNVGTLNASIATVSLWLKADALNSDIIDFDSGTHSVEVSSGGTVTATGWSSPTIYIDGSDTASFPAGLATGGWRHVAVTTATAFSVTALQIGTETSYFNGLIDDVRVYSYPRSVDQAKQDYNNGASVRF